MFAAVLCLLGGAAPAAGALVPSLVTTGTLAGHVTYGATGISGMNVWLYSVPGNVWKAAATTDATGAYSFAALTPGTYRLQAWSSTNAYPTTWYVHGSSFATANDIVVPSGGAAPAADVNVATTGSLSGTVRHLGVGVPGTTVFLTLASTNALVSTTSTAGDGTYSFAALAPGSYKLAFLDTLGLYPASGYYADQPDVGSANSVAVTAGVNSVADQHVYTPAEQPIPPYTGNVAGPTVAVIGDSITQMSTHAIHVALDATADVAVRGINQQRIGQMQPVADKFAATNPQQVVIALGTNDASQTITTAQSEADLETMVASFPTASCITLLTLNDDTANAAFNGKADVLSDYLRAMPATHAQVQVADWQRVRHAYFAQGEPAGAWTTDAIHLTPLGQTAYAALMKAAVDACGATPAAVTGVAFSDANRNGVRDGGEPALAGLTFTLTGDDRLGNAITRTTTTAADGSWSFVGLPAGTYGVSETVPVTLGLPVITVGSAGGTETTTAVTGIVLAPGSTASGYVFGNPPSPASLYGAVYADLDGNGARGAGEPGLDRVSIVLDGTASNGDPVHLATTSAADGTWNFRNLNPGTYAVTEAPPNGFGASSTTVGTGFGGTGGPHTITGLSVAVDVVATGYLFGEVPVPAVQWANAATSPLGSVARSVAADAAGNSYVTGQFGGTITLGTGGAAVSLTSAGGADGYVAKYDATGVLQWAVRAGGTNDDEALKVAVAGGRVVVAGDFDGSATFGSGGAAVTLSGAQDAFVAVYDTDGALQWVRQVGGATRSVATSAAIDGSGNVLATGWVAGSGDFGGTTYSATGVDSVFVARYHADGSFDWVRLLDSPTATLAFDIAVDPEGNAYVGGTDAGVDFGGGVSYAGLGALDAFVAQYHPDGSLGWTRHLGNIGSDLVLGVAVDPTTGKVFVSGAFSWTVDFGNGVQASSNGLLDAFVANLDAGTGATVWVRTGGGDVDDVALRLSANGGRVSVTGSLGDGGTFDGTQVLAYGGSDAFVASYDGDGTPRWVRPVAGLYGEAGWGTATLVNGDVVAVGIFALHTAVMPGPVQVGLNAGYYPTQYLTRLNA